MIEIIELWFTCIQLTALFIPPDFSCILHFPLGWMAVLWNLVHSIIISVLPAINWRWCRNYIFPINVVIITFWPFWNDLYPKYLKQSIRFDFMLPICILNCHYLSSLRYSSILCRHGNHHFKIQGFFIVAQVFITFLTFYIVCRMGPMTLELQCGCPRCTFKATQYILCTWMGWYSLFLVVVHGDGPHLRLLLFYFF